MKKRLAVLCLAAITLTACGNSNTQADDASNAAASTDPTEVTVFAAASLTESLNQIKEVYESEHPEVELVYNFDSSGTLQAQIEEGAVCDLFISAGQKQMDGLGDLVKGDSRVDLLENTVVLVAPKGAENAPASFEDLANVSSIALGNSDVPVGQYSEEILKYMGLWDSLNADGKITFGSNVKEVTSQVAAAAVDCGIVYRTDAASEPEIEVVATAPAESYSPAIYPAAVLTNATQAEEAQAFLDYLKTDKAMDVFASVGFSRPDEA